MPSFHGYVGQRGNTEVAYTLTETLSFAEWFGWSHQGRLSWLAANDRMEQGFVVLWVKLSRIAPFYTMHFNVWKETGTEGRVLCESVEITALDQRWHDAVAIFQSRASRAGLIYWKREWWPRVHPTITQIDWDNPPPDSEDDVEERVYPNMGIYVTPPNANAGDLAHARLGGG